MILFLRFVVLVAVSRLQAVASEPPTVSGDVTQFVDPDVKPLVADRLKKTFASVAQPLPKVVLRPDPRFPRLNVWVVVKFVIGPMSSNTLLVDPKFATNKSLNPKLLNREKQMGPAPPNRPHCL